MRAINVRWRVLRSMTEDQPWQDSEGGNRIHPAAASVFRPTPWLRHRHLQTIAAALLPAVLPALERITLALDDGDQLDLWLTGPPAGRPSVLVLHGLEGSLASAYARQMLTAIAARGWCGAFLHARGSACRPNRLVRGYHSGDWQDAAAAGRWLVAQGATALGAVGVSLGANQVLVWLGTGAACPLAGAVAISPPFDLGACADALGKGFSRLYGAHLLRQMRASILAKSALNGWTRARLNRLRTFRAFDDAITAPQHGFAGVEDYYQRASCAGHLAGITVPTLILHALDDPFIPATSIPRQVPPAVTLRLLNRGGHAGFLHGWRARPWLPAVALDALAPLLAPGSGGSSRP